jgi:hypothetical protein
MWPKAAIAASVIAVFALTAVSARAEDLKVLARILYAADLADQANTYCILIDPSFSSKAKGRLGNMRIYAEHIKREVTIDLRQVDALAVMMEAAGAAKRKMESIFGNIKNRHDAAETNSISNWCNEVAKPLIKGVIATHDKDHAEIDKIMAKAKAR